jgi:hypothetical protein
MEMPADSRGFARYPRDLPAAVAAVPSTPAAVRRSPSPFRQCLPIACGGSFRAAESRAEGRRLAVTVTVAVVLLPPASDRRRPAETGPRARRRRS